MALLRNQCEVASPALAAFNLMLLLTIFLQMVGVDVTAEVESMTLWEADSPGPRP